MCKKKFCPIRQTVQKIIGDKLVTDRQTDNRQTTDRQTDIFELTPIQMGNFNFFFFFAYGRERTNGVKLIPPRSLRKFTLLTCFTRRVIIKWYWEEIGTISTFEWQTLFEKQNCWDYKVGNNILLNRLSCLNRKLRLDFLNLPFETNRIKFKKRFMLWTVLIVFCWLFHKFNLFCKFFLY